MSELECMGFSNDEGSPYWDTWEDRAPKARALCESLWPLARHSETVIKETKADSASKTISVRIVDEDGKPADYTLRMPWDEYTILSSVTISRFLRSYYKDLPVPEVIYFDNTRDNPFGHHYVIFRQFPGVSLQSCFHDLAGDQRLLLAKELGRFYTRLRGITDPTAGTLKIPVPLRDAMHARFQDPEVTVEPFGANLSGYHDDLEHVDTENGFLPGDQPRQDNPGLSAVTMMLLAPLARRLSQCAQANHIPGVAANAYQRCLDIVEGLVEMPQFQNCADVDFCLWHTDLTPENVMVDFSKTPVITGILGWDAPVFAPRFFPSPPTWLWLDDDGENNEKEEEEEEETCSDYTSSTGYFQIMDFEADTPGNQLVKEAFEEAVGPDWAAQAYQPYSVFARRVLQLSLRHCGFLEETWLSQLDETMRAWGAYSGTSTEDGSVSSCADSFIKREDLDDGASFCSQEPVIISQPQIGSLYDEEKYWMGLNYDYSDFI